jgi:antitoxin ParD1/3/4
LAEQKVARPPISEEKVGELKIFLRAGRAGIPPSTILPSSAKLNLLPRMSTMNISWPDQLKALVDEQVSQRGYSTSSVCVQRASRTAPREAHAQPVLSHHAGTAHP